MSRLDRVIDWTARKPWWVPLAIIWSLVAAVIGGEVYVEWALFK